MQTVLALCHFCENHGPRTVIVTQSFKNTKDSDSSPFAHLSSVDECYAENEKRCLACSSFPYGKGLISYDDEYKYISTQAAISEYVHNLMKNACIRSLSCEISVSMEPELKSFEGINQRLLSINSKLFSSPTKDALIEATNNSEKEGVVLYGDDEYGYCLSFTFRLRDSKARGFHRLFSLIVFCMEKLILTENYDFFVLSISSIVTRLQKRCDEVFMSERNRFKSMSYAPTSRSSHPPAKLLENTYSDLSRYDTSRNLKTITDCPEIFRHLHRHMSWILKYQTHLCVGSFLEGSPSEDTIKQIEIESFTFREADYLATNAARDNLLYMVVLKSCANMLEKSKTNRKNFLKILLTHAVLGELVIIRCDDRQLADHFLLALSNLLPIGCVRMGYCSSYNDCISYNLCVCPTSIILPRHGGFVSISIYMSDGLGKDVDRIISSNSIYPAHCSLEQFGLSFGSCMNAKEEFELEPYECMYSQKSFNGLRSDLLHYIEYCVFSDFVYPDRYSSKYQFPAIALRYSSILLDMDLNERTQHAIIKNIRDHWLDKTKLFFQFNVERMNADKAAEILHCSKSDFAVLRTWEAGISESYKESVVNSLRERKHMNSSSD